MILFCVACIALSQAFGEDVAAVIRKLDLRRVILVGHSMGGPAILEAAALVPDRVIGLVPVDTFHDVEFTFGDKFIETALDDLAGL